MDYEQKYKNALERARELMTNQNPPAFDKHLIEIVFPELAESEDEKIKKAIKKALQVRCGGSRIISDEPVILEEAIAWLEKQGKQTQLDYEHADIPQKDFAQIEPKFKVGDWVLNSVCLPMQIASIKDGMYIFTKGDAMSVLFIDGNYHLWTIQDAMDGDVLVDEDNNIGIYVGEKDDFWHSCIYLGYDSCLREIGGYHKHNNTKPATKEQRDLLFKEIHDAEYEWDANKKELKKIESKTLDADEVIEWLKKTIRAHSENYGVYKATRLTLPYNSIEDLINDFKEDFGLC